MNNLPSLVTPLVYLSFPSNPLLLIFVLPGRGNLTWGEIVRAVSKEMLLATSKCWSLLGNYASSVKYTVSTLVADDAILERAIKQGSPHVKFIGG